MDSIKSKEYSFKDIGFTFDVETKLVQQLYVKIKALEEWYGAIDV